MAQNFKMDSFLNNVNSIELMKRIIHYNSIDKSRYSYNKIIKQILLTIFGENDHIIKFNPKVPINKGEKMFRARILPDTKYISKLDYEASYWEKPQNKNKSSNSYGRLNLPNESNIYLSNDIYTCYKEVKCEVNDIILLSVFDVDYPIELNSLLFEDNLNNQLKYFSSSNMELNNQGLASLKILNTFCSKLFNLDRGINSVGYKQSNAIAKFIYNTESNTQYSGWFYKSRLTDFRTKNICLSARYAHEHLKLGSSIVFKVVEEIDNSQLVLQKIAIRKPDWPNYISSKDNEFNKLLNEYFPQINSKLLI